MVPGASARAISRRYSSRWSASRRPAAIYEESVMTYYRRVGQVPPKRHTQFRQPDGSLYAEELMGEEGFTADASLLYHRHLPTAIVSAEAGGGEPGGAAANHPLLPRHFRTHALKTGGD